MNYRTTSSKYIIKKIFRDFRIDGTSNMVPSIYEWICEGIQEIGTSAPLLKKSSPNEDEVGAIMITSFRHPLPVDLISLLAVEYKGRKLPFGGDVTGYGLPDHARSTKINQPITLIDIDGVSVQGPYIGNNDYYLINPNYIQTSFETGFVKLHYEAYPIDEAGLPIIPEDFQYKEALTWYVIRQMLSAGATHPIFSWQMAHELWERHSKKARNSIMFPSIDEVDLIGRTLNRLVKDISLPLDFFAGSESIEDINLS